MFLRHNIPGIAWALFILALCGLPGDKLPGTHLIGFDKIVHFGIYALFVVILIVGFKKQSQFNPLRHKAILIAVLFSIGYGILIEVLQGTVFVSRSIELPDVLANTLGSLFGLVCFHLIYRSR